METSATIKDIATALGKFQALEITITKDATNPHFRSKFASLDNIIESIREPLAAEGLSFAQFPDGDGLTTVLMHTSGEWMKATANLKLAKEDPQGQGSAYTYARRYALSAILGLATEEDDDAEATKAPQKPAAARTAPKAAPGDAALAAKKRIAELLTEHDGAISTDRAEVAKRIQQLADLDPADEGNLVEIMERISHLLDEKNSK